MPKIVAQKRDWLKLGYQLFSQEGIKGVVVENMAKKLKCNKSSFYWHFKSKTEFVSALINYWVETETNQIIDQVEAEKTPGKKYNRFIELVFQKDPYVDFIFFLKRYAQSNVEVKVLIDEIDEQRVAYTLKIFQELGYSKKQSKSLANIFYQYLIGYHEMNRYKPLNKDYAKEVKAELSIILKGVKK